LDKIVEDMNRKRIDEDCPTTAMRASSQRKIGNRSKQFEQAAHAQASSERSARSARPNQQKDSADHTPS
jgi:hypothetical protein